MEKTEKKESGSAPKTETKSTASATASSGQGKKILIIVLVLLVVCAVVCGIVFLASGAVLQNAVNNVSPDLITNQIEDRLNDELADNGNGEDFFDFTNPTWPSDMPASVPQIASGTITSTAKGTADGKATWTVIYTDLASDVMAQYRTQLTAKGWTMEDSSFLGDAWIIATNSTLELSALQIENGMTLSVVEK